MDFIEQAAESFVEGLRRYYEDSAIKTITLSYKKLVSKLSMDLRTKPFVQVLANQIEAESNGYGDGSASSAIATRAQIIWEDNFQSTTGIRLQMKGVRTELSKDYIESIGRRKENIDRVLRATKTTR